MIILVEGPDASGKSTLVGKLQAVFKYPVQISEGPEKYPGEIIERVRKYLLFEDNWIFDRHPCVGQMIYGLFGHKTLIPQEMIDEFYSRPMFIIYCRSLNLPHEPREVDTVEHLLMIQEKDYEIKNLYDEWAVQRAQYIYRANEPLTPLMDAIAGALKL